MIVNNAGQLLAFSAFHDSDIVMEQTAICQALKRIESALTRLEAASSKTATLRMRHDKLKAAVEQSLGEIDTLISRQEP